MAVGTGRRDENCEAIEQVKGCETEHDLPVGAGLGKLVEKPLAGAVPAQPFPREGRPGALTPQTFESGPVVRLDADGRIE